MTFNQAFRESFKALKADIQKATFAESLIKIAMSSLSGWNGIQICLSSSLLFLFIETNSVYSFIIKQTLENKAYLPMIIYFLFSFFLIHWFLHCLSESYLNNYLMHKSVCCKKLVAVAVNTALPVLGFFLLFAFIGATLFFIASTLYDLLTVWGVNIPISEITLFIYIIIGLIITAFYFVSIYSDFIYPLLFKEKTFSEALSETTNILNDNFELLLKVFVYRIIMIAISMLLYILFLRFIFFPIFTSISLWLTDLPIMLFKEVFTSKEIIENMLIIGGYLLILLFTGIFFLPFYLQQKYMLKSLFKNQNLFNN